MSTVTLSFKVEATQARAIRRAARVRNLQLSEYLRQAAVPKKEETRLVLDIKKHPVSGLYYNAGTSPAPTQEEIDNILSNFP